MSTTMISSGAASAASIDWTDRRHVGRASIAGIAAASDVMHRL
jgi:hypothetical protein